MKHKGNQSVLIEKDIYIIATASVVGKKEGEGPLAKYFDVVHEDILLGEDSWEKAESRIVQESLELSIKKSGLNAADINYVIAGDLLNQSIGSTFGIKEIGRPFFGIFGACSTMGESMSIGSMILDGGAGENILVGASSHFCSAEKQFRFPLELGAQRPLTASWTVTGDGSAILSTKKPNNNVPKIKRITTGKIVDMGITDANNMGAAMAPAAVSTIKAHFEDFNLEYNYYDLIITGDLGHVGKQLVLQLLKKDSIDISKNYSDCGVEIFDQQKQDTHAGGSGCGCSAVTFSGMLYSKLLKGELEKILFVPTGALLSTTSTQQGSTIPAIAHAVAIEI